MRSRIDTILVIDALLIALWRHHPQAPVWFTPIRL